MRALSTIFTRRTVITMLCVVLSLLLSAVGMVVAIVLYPEPSYIVALRFMCILCGFTLFFLMPLMGYYGMQARKAKAEEALRRNYDIRRERI